MTLDEAIKHCEEVATKNEESIAYYTIQGDKEWLDECEKDCIECASEHRQLAEWLRELERYRNVRRILSQNRIATDRYGEVVLWDDIKRVLEEVNADADSN